MDFEPGIFDERLTATSSSIPVLGKMEIEWASIILLL